jgi:hypothetical protein
VDSLEGGVTGRRWIGILAGVWLVGALVVWNTVFDAHIVRGARNYVDRQQAFIDGRGAGADMDQAMNAARAEGLRAAWRWTAVELAPGLVLAALWWFRSRRGPGGRPDASR